MTEGKNESDRRPEEIIERFKYAPLDGGPCDLEQLEMMAQRGARISAVNPVVFTPLYRKYGQDEELQQRFEKEVGYCKETDDIKQAVEDVAKELGLNYVEESLIVLDNQGEKGALRAYNWPFAGVQYKDLTTYIPEGAKARIVDKLKESGIETRRVADIWLNPKARTQRGATTAVFIAKV